MMRWLLALGAIALFTGCGPTAPPMVEPTPEPTQEETEEERSASLGRYAPSPSPKSSLPRSLDITLTLNSPDDLRVKTGDEVDTGQILSDRSTENAALEARLNQLQLELTQLQSLNDPKLTLPEPPQSQLAAEKAAIAQSQQAIAALETRLEQQETKIAQIQELSNPEVELASTAAEIELPSSEDDLSLIHI